MRNGPLERMWLTVYWCTFLMTYIIIPIVQEYIAAGEFTVLTRLKASIYVNLVFYLILGVIALGALAYVVIGAGLDVWALFPLLISLANTYGLVLVVLLIGYGCAEVPRAIWAAAAPESALRRLQFSAPDLEGRLFDTKSELADIVSQVRRGNAAPAARGEWSPTRTPPRPPPPLPGPRDRVARHGARVRAGLRRRRGRA